MDVPPCGGLYRAEQLFQWKVPSRVTSRHLLDGAGEIAVDSIIS
jgi:hypothetical protein